MKKLLFTRYMQLIGLEVVEGSHMLYNLNGDVSKDFEPISLLVDDEGKIYGGVSESKTAFIKTNTRFYDLPDFDREFAMSTMYEYSMTELNER